MARDPYDSDPDRWAPWTPLDHLSRSITTAGNPRSHYPNAAEPTYFYHAVPRCAPGSSRQAARPYPSAREPSHTFGPMYPPPLVPPLRDARGVTIIHNPGLGIMLQSPPTPPSAGVHPQSNVLDPTVSPYIPGFGGTDPTPPPSPGEEKPSPSFELFSSSPNLSEHSEGSHVSSHVRLFSF